MGCVAVGTSGSGSSSWRGELSLPPGRHGGWWLGVSECCSGHGDSWCGLGRGLLGGGWSGGAKSDICAAEDNRSSEGANGCGVWGCVRFVVGDCDGVA